MDVAEQAEHAALDGCCDRVLEQLGRDGLGQHLEVLDAALHARVGADRVAPLVNMQEHAP